MSCERERFLFLLARTFPHRAQPWDVDALLEEMGEDWFESWFTVYQNNPWGPERDDWRMRVFAAISGVPGNIDWLTWPASFEAAKTIRALREDPDDEQQDEETVIGKFKLVAEGMKRGG